MSSTSNKQASKHTNTTHSPLFSSSHSALAPVPTEKRAGQASVGRHQNRLPREHRAFFMESELSWTSGRRHSTALQSICSSANVYCGQPEGKKPRRAGWCLWGHVDAELLQTPPSIAKMIRAGASHSAGPSLAEPPQCILLLPSSSTVPRRLPTIEYDRQAAAPIPALPPPEMFLKLPTELPG